MKSTVSETNQSMSKRKRLETAFALNVPDRTPILGGWIACPEHIMTITGATAEEYWSDPTGVSILAYQKLDTDGLVSIFVPRNVVYEVNPSSEMISVALIAIVMPKLIRDFPLKIHWHKDIDMTEYHIVRLTKDGEDFKVYLDDEKKPLWEGKGEAGEVEEPTVTLGDGTGTAGAESYWDYVAYTTDGAFPPDVPVVFAVASGGKLTITWAAIKR